VIFLEFVKPLEIEGRGVYRDEEVTIKTLQRAPVRLRGGNLTAKAGIRLKKKTNTDGQNSYRDSKNHRELQDNESSLQ